LADVPPQVWASFERYRWPGNVRELRNAVQRMLVTPERALEAPELAGPEAQEQAAQSTVEFRSLRAARREASDRFERDYLHALLRRAGGNITVAAALAQVSRQAIHKMITKHRL
jgi:two-component system response regulator PilR (NtrC family)